MASGSRAPLGGTSPGRQCTANWRKTSMKCPGRSAVGRWQRGEGGVEPAHRVQQLRGDPEPVHRLGAAHVDGLVGQGREA